MQMLLDDLIIKLGLVIFGREMMIKLVNGIPEKLVEMDEKVTFVEQMNQDTGGPIMIDDNYSYDDVPLELPFDNIVPFP
jgi:hypothetical protein